MKAAVNLLAMADTEKVAILGDMLNLGEGSHRYHGEIGRQAGLLGIGHILCVGSESEHMFREAQAHVGGAIAEGSDTTDAAQENAVRAGVKEGKTFPAVQAHGKAQVRWYPDTNALLEALAADCGRLVPEGSTVLIKASHDMGFAGVLEHLKERAQYL